MLKIISRSTFDLHAVLDTLVRSAVHLCDAETASINRAEGDGYMQVASCGHSSAYKEFMQRHPIAPGRGTLVGRTISDGRTVHIPDALADPEYKHLEAQRVGAFRTMLGVPLLREGTPIGVLALTRSTVHPFTEKQIELLETFADQAVIAIENTRLLNELRQRTDALSEALEQQTATSEVLQVISSSPGELQAVFETILENAVQICAAKFGNLFLSEGNALRAVALHGAPPAYVEERQRNPVIHPGPKTTLGRAMTTKQSVQIADIQNYKPDSSDDTGVGTTGVKLVKLAGARTVLAVPMVKESELVGAIVIYRQEVRPFTDKQIELVQNFAAQAVIAIENTRLLNELRESLQQQTATADVLKVISSSLNDLKPVFDIIGQRAEKLCDAEISAISMVDGELIRLVSINGVSKEGVEAVRNAFYPMRRDDETLTARAIRSGAICHVPDVLSDALYPHKDAARVSGFRGSLGVPMIREGQVIGAIFVARRKPGFYTDAQVQLMKTFADQAVIAIENVRLFERVEARTQELAKSLEELRTTQDRLVQTQKLALLGQLTAGIAHEIKNPLNFVNNFSGISAELIDELQDTLKGMPLDDKARTEINELTDTLKSNFDKVVHHGRRADAIVKNMLQHSREGSGEHRVIDINALVEESLNLAWHGARAETQGFEVKLKQSLDPSAGEADVFPQDIRRALLNLIANGFYAVTRRRAETKGADYEPTLTASTKNLGDRVEVSIRDNGTGIAPDVKEKMFEPFFTTKPAGEGTGLGLSISHDIIVKQHAGSIEVDTQLGEFTEIRIILPRAAVFL